VGWLTGWSYRKSHVISAATGAGTNYQVKITVHYGSGSDSNGDIYCNSHCRTDFGDIRFTDNDETTLLDCWMESKTNSNNAVFWVEVADSLESSNVTIYIYYGNATATYPYLATDLAQGEATFLFFDNFVDNTIDTAKWQTYGSGGGSISETGGEMVVTGASGAIKGAYGKTSWQYGIAIRYRGKIASNSGNCFIGLDDFDGSTSHGYCSSYIYVGSVLRHYTNNGSSGGSTDIGGGGNYNLVDISYLSGQSKCWLNNTLVSTRTTTVPTIALPVNIQAAAANSQTNMDWVLVRKYVVTEPAHSTWGSEQTQGVAYSLTVTEIIGMKDTKIRGRILHEIIGLKDWKIRSRIIQEIIGCKDWKIRSRIVREIIGFKDSEHVVYHALVTVTEIIGFLDSHSRSKAIHRTFQEIIGVLQRVTSTGRAKHYDKPTQEIENWEE
jgi:hypothetical protein